MGLNDVRYFGFRRTRGDASRVDTASQGVPALLVPTGARDMHFASAADEQTDWNVANPTHPTLHIHSETTPATDYISLSHDGDDAVIGVTGGNLILGPDGTSGTYVRDDALLGLGASATARLSWDTTDANANELLLQMPAGGAVDVPVLAIGQSIESVDLGLFNGVVDPTIAIFGVGAVATGPRLRVYKARGTIASPTVVTTADDLFSIDAYGAVAAGEYVQAARILFEMTGTIATTRGPGVITFQTATDAAPSVLTTALTINSAQKLIGAAGMALTTGNFETVAGTLDIQDGGAVTQLTSKATGVTLNTYTGQITLNNAALAADAIVSFTLTNSVIAANDIIVLQHHSVATVGAYVLTAQPGAGSCVINVANRSAGSLSEAIVISFAVIKAAVT